MSQEKYLVTIEFRYSDAPGYSGKNKVTIGVYDDFEDACIAGNQLMAKLESKFPLHEYPDGRKAGMERFSKHGGPFGTKKDLISNRAYLKTPFDFYAKITTLRYSEVDNAIENAVAAGKRYKEWKDSDSDE